MNTNTTSALAYRQVACFIDESGPSKQALHVAAQMCSLAQGRLRVVHVVSTLGSDPLSSSDDAPVSAREARRAGDLLRHALGRVRGEPVILTGSRPAAAACEWAATEGIDLLVAAAHRGRLARLAHGSFAGYLAHHAPCSALLVRAHAGGRAPEDGDYRHIACFVDGSLTSAAAVDEASALARTFGARLSIVHVSGVPFAMPLSWQELPRVNNFSTTHSWLSRQADELEGAEPVALVGFGQPAELACAWAEQEDVDLVVAAPHSGALVKLPLGSFTSYLTYHAPCSVLIAHQRVATAGRGQNAPAKQMAAAGSPRSR